MVADAIGQEEINVGILQGEALGGVVIVGEKAARDARQQFGGRVAEAIRHLEHVAQSADDAGFRTDGRLFDASAGEV